MRTLDPTLNRSPAFVLFALLALVMAGCDGSGSSYRSPTAPNDSTWTTYVGDATVISSSQADVRCEWWKSNTNVWWEVQIVGNSIVLQEEMEIQFEGTIQERNFIATYIAPAGQQPSSCPVKESSISGIFSEGFRSFEALETIVWGPAEHPSTTQRRWTALRP